MSSITVQEMKGKQDILSKHILGLIKIFELETGTKVDSIFFKEDIDHHTKEIVKSDVIINVVM